MAEGRSNDFTVSARLPICLFADVVAAFESKGYPDPRGSASAVVRTCLVLVRNSLSPDEREHFQESSTALSFLGPKGFSTKQSEDPRRNPALFKSLQQESVNMEKQGNVGDPRIAAAVERRKREDPEGYEKAMVQRILSGLTNEDPLPRTTPEEADAQLRAEWNMTLEQAVEKWDEKDTIRRFLDAQDIV